MIRRALLSVSDKRGMVELAKALEEMGVSLLSTGGTAKLLREAGVSVMDVSEATGFPECLDGRVKTLHPAIHGGILAIRDNEAHMETLKKMDIEPIDLIVVNLYPFKETILKPGVTQEEAIENIDIGGPAMLRSAAKNYQDVTVVVNPEDYGKVLAELGEMGHTTLDTRYELAKKVFQHTAHYDTMIASYLSRNDVEFPETLTLTYERVQNLRYGENPHQQGAFYQDVLRRPGTLADARQLQGKELSFNNINDVNGALQLLKEFSEPTVVAVKHTNPCGVASGDTIYEAYQRTYEADSLSIFGGIIAVNREIDKQTAEAMKMVFLEVIIAPSFTAEALAVFQEKKNLRLLQLDNIDQINGRDYDLKRVAGGLLIQNSDASLMAGCETVTDRSPSAQELNDLEFAFKVVKHIKSNAIVIVKNQQTLAIGPGQTSRIWALENALRQSQHSLEGSVLASDAFFPFRDCVDAAVKAGIRAIIQPGGSVKDQQSIEACNEAGIAMVFTGMRHFKH